MGAPSSRCELISRLLSAPAAQSGSEPPSLSSSPAEPSMTVGTHVSGATISADGVYRYKLLRCWGVRPNPLVWIMWNPSTADAAYTPTTQAVEIRKPIGLDPNGTVRWETVGTKPPGVHARSWGRLGQVVSDQGLTICAPSWRGKRPRRPGVPTVSCRCSVAIFQRTKEQWGRTGRAGLSEASVPPWQGRVNALASTVRGVVVKCRAGAE